jgi:hypothetical protein
VGRDLGWLERALGDNPDVSLRLLDPADFEGAPRDVIRQADALVFVGWAPSEPPARPALLFAPPDVPWLALPGEDTTAEPLDERQPRWSQPVPHPVLLGVDPFTLLIGRARRYPSPAPVPIAVSERGTPLVSVHDGPAARAVVVAFGPDDSNLPIAPGFPVLLSNALDWLARPSVWQDAGDPDRSRARRPGLAAFDPFVRSVTDPHGREVPLVRAGDRVAGLLREPGLYVAQGFHVRRVVTVNAGDPEISDLSRTTLDGSDEAHQVARGRAGRPWWVALAIAAFLLVSIEWWTWQQRITV